jgi:hypothetical protein
MRNIVITIITIILAIGVVTSAPVKQEQLKPLEKIVPLEEDASEAVSVATDSAIKQAKKSTKNAIAKMAKGQAPATTQDSNDADENEAASMVSALGGDSIGILSGGGPKAAGANTGASSTGGTGGTGTTGSTGATGNTGASGATGNRLWFFAPKCNGRGSLHTILNKCMCHKKHTGNTCEYKNLRTGEFNHELKRIENHGRYVGVSKCKNGTPMGENDCVCFPGFSGYHCDQKECRNGKMVCAGRSRFCTKSTVCRCDPGFKGVSCDRVLSETGNTGATGLTGMTGASGATGSAFTGPAAPAAALAAPAAALAAPRPVKKIKRLSKKYQRPKPRPAYKQTTEEYAENIAKELQDRMPATRK